MEVDFPDCGTTSTHVHSNCKQMGEEEKKLAIQVELSRIEQLPAGSAYAIHRRRVLNKILHLMSIQRSASDDQELELLFTKLSV